MSIHNQVIDALSKGSYASQRAIELITETGADPATDVRALRTGAHTRASMLAYCLDGAEGDRVDGWTEYVEAVVAVAIVAESHS